MRPRFMLTKPSSRAIRGDLFPDTSHSPSLAELVGYERAAEIIDFCFIANPYYTLTLQRAHDPTAMPVVAHARDDRVAGGGAADSHQELSIQQPGHGRTRPGRRAWRRRG